MASKLYENQIKNKEELIETLKKGLPFARRYQAMTFEERKKTGNSNFVYLFPFHILFFSIILSIVGFPIPWNSPIFYLLILAGWYVATKYRRHLVAKRKVIYAQKREKISQEFHKETGLRPNLCDIERLNYMIEFLETGQADTFKEALKLADKKYHDVRVIANQEYIMKKIRKGK